MSKKFKKLEYWVGGGVVAGAYTYYNGTSWMPWAAGGAVSLLAWPFVGPLYAGAAGAAAYVAATPATAATPRSSLSRAYQDYLAGNSL